MTCENKSDNKNETCLTPIQAAKQLGTSTAVVYKLLSGAKLRAYRIGGTGQWRIPESAIDEHMEKFSNQTQ